MNQVITVGREFGSGGRELGRRLADKLGIAYYDREIVAEIAKRTSLSEEYIQHVTESRPAPLFPITIGKSFRTEMGMLQMQQTIYQEQSKILREMTERSACVIVGRCADYILRDHNPYRIFVYADLESRIARCIERSAETEKLTSAEAKKQIAEIDRARAKYYAFYTDQKWGDKANYDICINTTHISVKDWAAHLTKMLE